MKRSRPLLKLPELYVQGVGGRVKCTNLEYGPKQKGGVLVKKMKEIWLFFLLFMAIGCSANLNSNETSRQQEMENDSFRCEKITDARLGGRGVPDWQRAYEECMVTGGQ